MRNIDYRALYEKVQKNQDAIDPKKRRGTYDNLTHDQRTQKAIDGNVARSMSVNLRDKGMGTGKNGVSPVEPANLKAVDESFQENCQSLIDEGFCEDIADVYRLMDILEQMNNIRSIRPYKTQPTTNPVTGQKGKKLVDPITGQGPGGGNPPKV
jgi:hypothetical protein